MADLFSKYADALARDPREERRQTNLEAIFGGAKGLASGMKSAKKFREDEEEKRALQAAFGQLPMFDGARVPSADTLKTISPFISSMRDRTVEVDPVDRDLNRQLQMARIEALRNPPSPREKPSNPLDDELKQAKIEALRRVSGEKEIRAKRATDRMLSKSKQLIQRIDDALGKTGPMTAGFIGSATRKVPGTPAFDLGQDLMSIKSNIGFETLQDLRASSPTGGALGQVSDTENELMQSVWGSLQQAQSPQQLKENLNRIRPHFSKVVMAIEGQTGDEEADNAVAQIINSDVPDAKKWAMIKAVKARAEVELGQ